MRIMKLVLPMIPRFTLILAASTLLGLLQGASPEELPRYRIPRNITPAYPNPVRGEAIRPKVLELLGLGELPTAVSFKKENSETTSDGLSVTTLSFQNSLGETVPGVLITPVGAGTDSLPGVVCMPGTGGDAARMTEARFYRDGQDEGPLMGWARELARRGFATLSITLKGTVARRRVFEDWDREARLLAPYGRSQMGLLVEEALSAARVLARQPMVDAQRIGLTGFSLGGYAAWWAAACDPSIAASAPLCGGLGSLALDIHDGDPDRQSSFHYVPGLLRYFDHPEIVASCIAPRPLMLLAPLHDPDMPASGIDQLLRVANPAYLKAGHPEKFKVYRPNDGHVFRVEYFEWMAEWFRSSLVK